MITAAEARKTYETSVDGALQQSLALINEHIENACKKTRSLTMNSSQIKADHREVVKNLEARGFKAKFNSCQRDGEWFEISW